KGIGFENPSYFEKAKDLRLTLYDEKVIGLGYTPMFLTHSDEALEIEKFKRSRENKIKFAYDYRNLNTTNKFTQTIYSECDSEKIIIDLEDKVVNLLEKEKVNLETIESLKSKGVESSETVSSESKNQSENDCHVVEKQCGNMESSKVIAPGMFKLNVSQCVSPISMSKSSCDSKNVEIKLKGKRRETRSAFVCNNAMNVSCDSRMNDLLDDNNFFIFDDVNVKISPVCKMPFRKKLRDAMHIVQICLWIIDSGCSNHMTGNRALLMNFVEMFLETVRFGNNDFAVIAGYGDVVIDSMTIKKVHYSTCFVRNKDGVDLLTGDRSSSLYTIALNEVASNSSTCLLAKASSSQSWLWHQRLSHLNFTTINNLVKINLVQGLPKMKFEKDHLCFACEQGIMGEPLSSDRVFDFPVDEPKSHPAYDFFGPRLLPGAWIMTDEPMVGTLVDEIAELIVEAEEQVIALMVDMDEDIAMLFGNDDFKDDDSKGFDGEVNEKWLMAFVTPPPMQAMPSPSVYEVEGTSTTVAEGQSFFLPTPGLHIPPSVIEDLTTRLGNLDIWYFIGENLPRGFAFEGQVQMMASYMVHAAERFQHIGTQVEHGQQTATWRDEVIARLTQQMQALQAVVQQRDSQIQQLQTKVSEMNSRESTLMQCILGMDR
nr:hypothetical protein [Tanacetum cinerariifolium]